MPSFAGLGSHTGTVGPGGVVGAFGGAYGNILSPTSPLHAGAVPPSTRVRTVSSTMYMLGLGTAGGASSGRRASRVASTGVNVTAPASPLRSAGTQPFPRSRDVELTETPPEADPETEEEEDTDVE